MTKLLSSPSQNGHSGKRSGRSRPTVAIIGAGLGGIATAVHLKRAGISSFTIFEQSAGPGGTWWDNTYPGAECDIEIALYSYSFMKRDWPRTHASQPEIQAYVQSVIDRFELAPHLRFNTGIASAVWDDQRHFYTVATKDGTSMQFDVVVAALGLLNVPRYPEWPGLDRFPGPKFHTARWEHQHDLRGKRVAVVGNGSSAAQVVPAIAPVVGHVTMFAREPAYVMPKNDRALLPDERRQRQTTFGHWLERARIFWRIERRMSVRNPRSAMQRRTRDAFFRYRDRVFAERSDLRTLMTPDYPFACKRPIASSDLLPALTRDNVTVVPRSVASVSDRGLIDSEGDEHPVDAIVMATGFQPWNFLATLEVIGRGGRTIHGVWGNQPEAFLGIQVAGFPNFFLMYGPNTNYMCVTFMLERQAEYIARAVRRLIRERATAIDVRRSVMDAYNALVDRSLSSKTLSGNCRNYYHSATGRNVVTWPWRGTVYVLATRLCGFALFTRRADVERQPRHLELERSTASPKVAPAMTGATS
jgi:cation diffusion facilitator CzcD-associated flavoprotein CzcO